MLGISGSDRCSSMFLPLSLSQGEIDPQELSCAPV